MISEPTKRLDKLVERLEEIQTVEGLHVPGMMAGSTGLVCEAAELKDIVKKVLYQGKEVNPALITHMKKELGDVAFYFVLMCLALGTTPGEVVELNVEKLRDRFSSGKFSAEESEVRKVGDI